MRRRPPDQTDAPGQDSFLDVVANLVGILLILIMVVGLRTKSVLEGREQPVHRASQGSPAMEARPVAAPVHNVATAVEPAATPPQVEVIDVEPVTDPPPESPESADAEPLPDAEGAARETAAVEQHILETSNKLKRQQLEIDYRRRERDRIQVLVSTAERELAAERERLSADQQNELRSQEATLAAERELEQLKTQLQALNSSTQQIERLDHLPTPMAKTVFGKEIHFRLHRGRLALVPWDDLVTRLKEDAPNKIWKLKEEPKITETIGPLDGFRLRYTLKKSEHPVRVEGGTAMQQRVSLDFFHLIPTQDEIGEPVQAAIGNPASRLNNVLGSNDAKTTTITVWVYPDSFEAYRDVKQYLFQKGFLTASRPMPEGRYMGGAPDGSRSASQ